MCNRTKVVCNSFVLIYRRIEWMKRVAKFSLQLIGQLFYIWCLKLRFSALERHNYQRLVCWIKINTPKHAIHHLGFTSRSVFFSFSLSHFYSLFMLFNLQFLHENTESRLPLSDKDDIFTLLNFSWRWVLLDFSTMLPPLTWTMCQILTIE